MTDDLQIAIGWEYDAIGRLSSETYDSECGDTSYIIMYGYDLANNRLIETRTGDGAGEKTYSYDNNDRLADTGYAYDANGAMTASPAATYAWDIRGRMTSATAGSVTTTYGYDSNGQRVSEQVGSGAVRHFLNDGNNPSGYPQVFEETNGSTLDRTYVLALTVKAQADASGVLRFVRDGHGSNRAAVDDQGQVLQAYDYSAFGDPVATVAINPVSGQTTDITAATALTTQLFGGDAEYAPSVNLYYHDARWRDGFFFISRDSYTGDMEHLLSLHKYLYAAADPITYMDMNGAEFSLAGLAWSAGLNALFNVAANYACSHKGPMTWSDWENFIAATFLDAVTGAAGYGVVSSTTSWLIRMLAQGGSNAFGSAAFQYLTEGRVNSARVSTAGALGAAFSLRCSMISAVVSSMTGPSLWGGMDVNTILDVVFTLVPSFVGEAADQLAARC